MTFIILNAFFIYVFFIFFIVLARRQPWGPGPCLRRNKGWTIFKIVKNLWITQGCSLNDAQARAVKKSKQVIENK